MATSRKVQLSGTITTRDQNSSAVIQQTTVTPDSGDTTLNSAGNYILVAGGGAQALPFGAISLAKAIDVNLTSNASGVQRSAIVTFTKTGGTTYSISATHVTIFCSENPNITAVSVTPQASGDDTLVEYSIAG